MERIKQALERARLERRSLSGLTTDSSARENGADKSRLPRRMPSSEGEKIVYTKTRLRQLDPARLREQRIIFGGDDDPVLTAYKMLRTRVLQRLRANRWNMLGVTSPREGNGKTLTAINLSISLARDVNQSVLLVDLDLRRPAVARYLFGESLPGIGEYLNDEKDVAELLINPGFERLVVLPGGRSYQHSSEMLSSPKMIGIVKQFRTRYPDRIVLFDLPPMLTCDDALAFSPYLDAIMLVVEEGYTEKEELRRVYELLDDGHVLGTVLNKSDDDNSSSGYYGSYGGYRARKN